MLFESLCTYALVWQPICATIVIVTLLCVFHFPTFQFPIKNICFVTFGLFVVLVVNLLFIDELPFCPSQDSVPITNSSIHNLGLASHQYENQLMFHVLFGSTSDITFVSVFIGMSIQKLNINKSAKWYVMLVFGIVVNAGGALYRNPDEWLYTLLGIGLGLGDAYVVQYFMEVSSSLD